MLDAPRHADGPDTPPRFIDAPDGRRLAYAEYGDPDGVPLLYCHGFPSSRREALLLHPAAVAAGARIIAADRPGYGESDDAPGRRITDWSDDLRRLADHLGLEHFGLLGISGGGPYAVVAAHGIGTGDPGRIDRCALICPLGPIYDHDLRHCMGLAVRASFDVARHTPWLIDIVYGSPTAAALEHWPGIVEAVRAAAAPAVDRRVLAEGDNAALLNRTIADAMQRGARGARRDLVLYTHDWQVPFEQITLPIRIWHGTDDGTVPIEHARWYAANLPNARLTELPGAGHFSVPLRHGPAILAELLAG